MWRWQTGAAYPSRELAEDLIALWARHGLALDYNGIYQPSVPGDE